MGKIIETQELYKYTINEITQNVENWQRFLDSSSWNFKYDFDDQVLIYAQRPEAKACAEMIEWNKKLKRWVNNGAKPIFVFSKDEDSQYPFRLVFDKSDTHNYNNTELKLWDIKKEYENEIIETLENNFGEISKKESLQQAIVLASYNMVVDNIEDYLTSIEKHKKGTMLENREKDSLKSIITTTVWSSVSYMMMTRCGINPKEFLDRHEFEYISNFNSHTLVTALGSAVSEIAEMGLREIAKTINYLQKNEKNKNRTIEKINKEVYAKDKEKVKGGIDYDENRVYKERELRDPKYNNEKGQNTNRQIRESKVQVSEGLSESRFYDNEHREYTQQTSNRDTRNSDQESRTDNAENGETRGNNRGIERKKSDEMGATYEQPENDSRGHSIQGDNLQQLDVFTQTQTKEFPQLKENKVRTSNKIQDFILHPEVAESERNNFKITDTNLGVGTPRQKFARNIEAIRVLKKCEDENRYATPEEQEILSQYVGWGGLQQAFDERDSSWQDEYKELKNLLNEEEYKQARSSTLTAFYTPPVVIESIYKALQNMGLKEANILEPSCGVGNFLGMLPNELSNCKMYGVEIDSISGRIAQQLYQKSTIAVDGYEKIDLPDSFFDIAIGNVPFGDFKVADKRYDKHKFLIHDYFFAKTIDKVRPNGVIAFITSKGTMDKQNPEVRKYIAQRAELIGTIRLPSNTFLRNAGTEVTSDILFLKKRESLTDIMPDWVYLDKDKNDITMNKYFVDNPQMILGTMEMKSTQYGLDSTCKAFNGIELKTLLNEAIEYINAEIEDYEFGDIEERDETTILSAPNVKNFSYTIVNGKVYFRENSIMIEQDLPATTISRIKGMIELRDCVRELIELQTDDFPDENIKNTQSKLNRLYDSFVRKYGYINSRGNRLAFSEDSSYYLLCSLEIFDDKGKFKRKADMFTKRTIRPYKEITKVDTANEALILSLSEKAEVNLEYMSKLSEKTKEELINELEGIIFKVPMEDEKYVTADEYLSGNVREKLKIAESLLETHPEFKINVKALKEVQPKDLTAMEIGVKLGSTWIPIEVIDQFMYELLDTPDRLKGDIQTRFNKNNSQWYIRNKKYDYSNVKANKTYGTNRFNAYEIIERTLNLKDIKVFDKIYIGSEEKREFNPKETAIVQAKQEQIKQEFENWVWKEQERRSKLIRIYNEKFNSIRPREYDGKHLNFIEMNPEITLRAHQNNAVARGLYSNSNTLLAHEVGAGKTFEMITIAMESKRLGLCNKSLFVVPNHIIEQFAGDFLKLYPSANIMVASKKDFATANRKKFCSRIATGEFDAVIIGHSQFEKIPMSIERQEAIIESQISDVINAIEDAKRDKAENFTIKQMEKTKRKLEERLKKLNDRTRKDDVINFEQLGVDRLFVDESHNYKNLFLYTKMNNVDGIAQTEAQKSSDLFMKCRYMDEITAGKGIVFATGTPVSNSMVELYTMQRYLQYNTLVKAGLENFDDWASVFGETITAIELSPDGTGYRAKTRFAKFHNLPELMAMFKEVADIQTSETLNLPTPEVINHNIVVKPSEIQLEMVKALGERADEIKKGTVDPSKDNMLKITNEGRKLALDQRLINPLLPSAENSKVKACTENIYKIWEENKEEKLTQLVFCDMSTPKDLNGYEKEEFTDIYNELKKELIKKGIPKEEIAFIHEAESDVKKKELFAKVRAGNVRVLIGSTSKMGARNQRPR